MANELKFSNPIVVGSFASDPSSAYNGEIYYNTTSNVFRIYQNNAWQNMASGSVSLTGQALLSQNILVGNGSNLSAAVDTSAVGDVLANSSTGLTVKAGAITNTHISASAAIALTKLAALTNHNRALVSDGSGFISESAVTATELGYLSGVTGAIQTQINGKVSKAGDTMSGDLDMGGNFITNLPTPTLAAHAANKAYVDQISQSLTWKSAVRSATTAALPAYDYDNGASGVGATLTGQVNGALPAQDGVALVNGDRLLVKDETAGNAPYNGIYVVTDIGSISTPYVLTRALDMDLAAEFFSAAVQVGPEATLQAGYGYRQQAPNPITVGTTDISFINFLVGTSLIFGDGLTQTGSNVDVTPGDASLLASPGSLTVQKDPAGAIITNGSGIAVQVDGLGIKIAANAIAAKLDTAGAIITTGAGGTQGLAVQLESSNPSLAIVSNRLGAKLDPAGALVSGASGIAAQVDNVTIEIVANELALKDSAVTNSKVATGAAIEFSKMEVLTNNRVVVTDDAGVIVPETTQAVALVAPRFSRGAAVPGLVEEEYVDAITLTDDTGSPSPIAELTFLHGNYAGVEIIYTIGDGTNLRIGRLLVVSNGTDTSMTDYSTETADLGVVFSASISGSNTRINYTTTLLGQDRTMRADVKRFRV